MQFVPFNTSEGVPVREANVFYTPKHVYYQSIDPEKIEVCAAQKQIELETTCIA